MSAASRRSPNPAAAGTYREGPAGLAYRALLEHTQMCEQCVDDVRGCATGKVLVRILREACRPDR